MARGNRDYREAMDYEVARLPRELTTAITWYMKEHNVRKSQLADRLGVTPGRVSQILSGDENMTLHTLAAVCAALNARLDAKLIPSDGQRHSPEGGYPSSPGWPGVPSTLSPAGR
jgi:transcriptional regulator with XRE-family HTH domain